MSDKTFTDEDDRTLSIGTCEGRAHAILRVDDGDRAEVCVSAADLPALTARLYEACGLPAPVMLTRIPVNPEKASQFGPFSVCAVPPRTVQINIDASGGDGAASAVLPTALARTFAACLVAYAEAADSEPDPAELAALMREAGIGEVSARAALRWMQEREVTP